MRVVRVLLLVALVTVAAPVSATILYLTDGRRVNAFGQPCTEPSPGQIQCDPAESESSAPSSPFAPFDASVSAGDGGSASQTSSIDMGAGTMSATGSAGSFSDVGFGEGESLFQIGFQLTSPTEITLSGLIEAEEFFGFGEALAQVRLTQDATTLYFAQVVVYADFDSAIVDFQDILPSGDYMLEALADGFGGSTSSYDLGFSSLIVPEPVSGALAAAGLLAMAALRRRGRIR